MIFLIGMQTRLGSLRIDPRSYGLMKSALLLLPQRVGFKVLRKALNAWGGFVRNFAKQNAPDETGLLKRSLRVKAVIPDASFNPKHHGKPAYVLVGPARNIVGPVVGGRVLSIRKATARVVSGGKVQTRRPSRYAHLIERGTRPHQIKITTKSGRQIIIQHPGTKAHPFIRPAEQAGATQGMAILQQKLRTGIEEEARIIGARVA